MPPSDFITRYKLLRIQGRKFTKYYYLLVFSSCAFRSSSFSQFSFVLLCLASLLTTLKENFGAPIDCIVDKDVPESVFEVLLLLEKQFFLFVIFPVLTCGVAGLLLGSWHLHATLPGILITVMVKYF